MGHLKDVIFRELLFEWSHLTILPTVSKVRNHLEKYVMNNSTGNYCWAAFIGIVTG